MRQMTKIFSGSSLVLLALVTMGCSGSLHSRPLSEGRAQGFVYAVPMLQYDLVLTRQVVTCAKNNSGQTKVRTTLEATETFVPNPRETFVVEFDDVFGKSKTGEFTVSYYENGQFKSINAKADDRSGEVVGNVAKAVVNTALLIARVGLQPELEPEPVLCTSDVVKAVETLSETMDSVMNATAAVERATANVQRWSLIVAAGPTDEAVKKLGEAQDILEKTTKTLSALEKQRAPVLAAVTNVQTLKWSPAKVPSEDQRPDSGGAAIVEEEHLAPPKDLAKKWFMTPEAAEPLLSVYGRARSVVSYDGTSYPESGDGIYYRHPVPVEIQFTGYQVSNDRLVPYEMKTLRAQAPQLGQLILLPFHNGGFQGNELEVMFRPNGTPEYITYKQTKAPAEAFSDVLAEVTEVGAGIPERIDNAKLNRLKRETDLLVEMKKFEDAKKALEPSPTADNEAKNAQANAELAKIQAQQALAAAKDSSPADRGIR